MYALAGIPVLFSALRALLIEGNSGMYGNGKSNDALTQLAKDSELNVLCRTYNLPQDLRERLFLLYEVRNEIVHPSHLPAGTSHGTPEYLTSLRDKNLLQSTNLETCDYAWIAQLKSHKLFAYAFDTIREVVAIILDKHHTDDEIKSFHLRSYSVSGEPQSK